MTVKSGTLKNNRKIAWYFNKVILLLILSIFTAINLFPSNPRPLTKNPCPINMNYFPEEYFSRELSANHFHPIV